MKRIIHVTTVVALAVAGGTASANQSADLTHITHPDAGRVGLPAMPAPETATDVATGSVKGFSDPSALTAKAASASPQDTALSPPVTVTYSGSSNALTVIDSGFGRAISASVTNANSGSSALYGGTVGSGAGLTGFNGGTGGPGGKFQITNANSAQAGVFATTIGSGPAVLGTITSAAAQYGQTAIMGVHSGGETTTGGNGRYGSAGHFMITNTNNFDSVLVATTMSYMGTAVEGDDFSADGGTAIYGVSTAGYSAFFSQGAGGTGTCSYDGGNGFNCPGSSSNVKTLLKSSAVNQVLMNLDRMPVAYYEMDGQHDGARHLGPSAADFRAAFNLGSKDSISTGDAQGVALTAAKGLYHKLQIDEAIIAADHEHIADLEHRLKSQEVALEAATARLEATIAQLSASLPQTSGYLARR